MGALSRRPPRAAPWTAVGCVASHCPLPHAALSATVRSAVGRVAERRQPREGAPPVTMSGSVGRCLVPLLAFCGPSTPPAILTGRAAGAELAARLCLGLGGAGTLTEAPPHTG